MRSGHTSPSADPLVQIVSVRRPLAAGVRITAADLAVKAVPSRWAEPAPADRSWGRGRTPKRRSAVCGCAADGCRVGGGRGFRSDVPATSRCGSMTWPDCRPTISAGTTADLYLVAPGRPPRIRLVIEGVQVVGSSATDGVMVATLRVSSGDVAALIEAESSGSLRLAAQAGAMRDAVRCLVVGADAAVVASLVASMDAPGLRCSGALDPPTAIAGPRPGCDVMVICDGPGRRATRADRAAAGGVPRASDRDRIPVTRPRDAPRGAGRRRARADRGAARAGRAGLGRRRRRRGGPGA